MKHPAINSETCDDKLVEKLSGYVDIGMKSEAVEHIGQILSKPQVSPEELSDVISSIGIVSDHRKWKNRIEAAYSRQSKSHQRQCKPVMLSFYWSLKEWEQAARFISIRSLKSPDELNIAMEVFLGLDRLDNAKIVARKCTKAKYTDEFEFGCLCNALGSYYARIRDFNNAFRYFSQIPRNSVHGNASIRLVELNIAHALLTIRNELSILRDIKPVSDFELCLPGNEEGILNDTKKRLLKMKHALEKIVPVRRQKELGMENPLP